MKYQQDDKQIMLAEL